MKIPKEVDVKSALEQINEQIARESATYVGQLVEKIESEIGFVEKVFSEDAVADFDKATRFLNGKNVASFTKSFHKLSISEQENYTEISDYKSKEIAINNSSVKMRNALRKLKVELSIKELLEESSVNLKK